MLLTHCVFCYFNASSLREAENLFVDLYWSGYSDGIVACTWKTSTGTAIWCNFTSLINTIDDTNFDNELINKNGVAPVYNASTWTWLEVILTHLIPSWYRRPPPPPPSRRTFRQLCVCVYDMFVVYWCTHKITCRPEMLCVWIIAFHILYGCSYIAIP